MYQGAQHGKKDANFSFLLPLLYSRLMNQCTTISVWHFALIIPSVETFLPLALPGTEILMSYSYISVV
jgi:hypothetical protein